MGKNATVDKMRRERKIEKRKRSQKSKLCTILRNKKEEVTREKAKWAKNTKERN
jgi:hypothetical protein